MPKIRLLQAALLAASIPALSGLGHRPVMRFASLSLSVADETPLYLTELLPVLPLRFVHGAAAAELPNGNIVAMWYGGEDEIQPDVVIVSSIRDHVSGRWSVPNVVEDSSRVRRALRMPVKSIGNPTLVADAHGVRMFFVAVVAGGWSGGTICMSSSPDGVHWSDARHVITSPFFNVGMLDRGAPLAYEDGSVALPIYREFLGKWPLIARVDADGHVVDLARIRDTYGRPWIQPWLVGIGDREALAFLRLSSRRPGAVGFATTRDGGASWTAVDETPLMHRDSAVAATQLADRSILVFYNSRIGDRREISIMRGSDRWTDGFDRWSSRFSVVMENAPYVKEGAVRTEHSYPFVIRTRDGRTHLFYTWRRSRICHVTFNDLWVASNPELRTTR
ncbi:MAG: exo-alpha-sialidase [Thermoanaerobaculia bacterium]